MFYFYSGALLDAFALSLYHRVDRVLSFFSSRPNWDSPTPSHASMCVPPPCSGGEHTRLRERVGGGGVPIRTRGQTLLYSGHIRTLCSLPYPMMEHHGTGFLKAISLKTRSALVKGRIFFVYLYLLIFKRSIQQLLCTSRTYMYVCIK